MGLTPPIARRVRRIGVSIGALLALVLTGCAASGPDAALIHAIEDGQFGYARSHLLDAKSRGEFADLVQLGMVNLGDGLAPESGDIFNEIYGLLRLRGVNENTRLAATVAYEGVKVFRGEPFEQALAYHYVALQKALVGDWGNARAASIASLELLDEFDDLRYERAPEDGAEGFEYAVQNSDFALGYLMAGIANIGLGRSGEAADYFRRAQALDDSLATLSSALLDGSADGVLIVDYGLGPIKLGEGASGSAEVFRPRSMSDTRPLLVEQGSAQAISFAQAEDTNRLSAIYTWDDLRGIREAKAILGDGLVVGGAVVAGSNDSTEGAIVGLGLIGLGLLTKATSHADTRQLETLAQRIYIVPIKLPSSPSPITLGVADDPGSRITLPLVRPLGEHERLRVMYVRLAGGRAHDNPTESGRLIYTSDASEPSLATLPYILGGTDVRTPSPAVTRDYHAAGLPKDMTTEDVRELYRIEGIHIGTDGTGGTIGRHVLEGGSWLYTPLPESAGFVRLFAHEHREYQPRSDRVRGLSRSIRAERLARVNTEQTTEEGDEQ